MLDPTLSDRSVTEVIWSLVPRPALFVQPFLLHYRCCAEEVHQTELLANRQSAARCAASFALNEFSVPRTAPSQVELQTVPVENRIGAVT